MKCWFFAFCFSGAVILLPIVLDGGSMLFFLAVFSCVLAFVFVFVFVFVVFFPLFSF